MNSEAIYGLSLALPGIQRAVAKQGVEAQRQITDAFILLEILGRGASRLGRRLHRERLLALASPVALVAAVTRQQVESAKRQAWLPQASHGLYGWDPTREWDFMSPHDAVDALCDEMRSIAGVLLTAVDFAPLAWEANLCRCAGSVLLVTANLWEVLQGFRGELNSASRKEGEARPMATACTVGR
jgi:hypothetical protein